MQSFLERLGRSGHLKGVGFGLLDDAQTDHGYRIATEHGARFHRAFFDPGDLAQTHAITVVAMTDDQFVKILGAAVAAFDARGKHALIRFQLTGRQLDVFVAQGLFDIGHRDLARGHGFAIQPDAYRVLQTAADTHPRHAWQYRKTILQIALRVIRQLQGIHAITGQIQPHDHVGIAVLLLNLGWIGLFRQIVKHTGYAITHIIGGTVDITVATEFDNDAGAPILTG